MSMQAIYMFTDSGMNGREKPSIVEAFTNEKERDEAFAANKNNAWYTKTQAVYDLEDVREAVLTKLNGLERLAILDPYEDIQSQLEAWEHGL